MSRDEEIVSFHLGPKNKKPTKAGGTAFVGLDRAEYRAFSTGRRKREPQIYAALG